VCRKCACTPLDALVADPIEMDKDWPVVERWSMHVLPPMVRRGTRARPLGPAEGNRNGAHDPGRELPDRRPPGTGDSYDGPTHRTPTSGVPTLLLDTGRPEGTVKLRRR
jgi:hypothetical protein